MAKARSKPHKVVGRKAIAEKAIRESQEKEELVYHRPSFSGVRSSGDSKNRAQTNLGDLLFLAFEKKEE